MPRALAYVLKIFVVALGYYVVGRFGILFAVSSGFATAVWPASGVALAAVLLWRGWVWPGVFLGSLLLHVPLTLAEHADGSLLYAVFVDSGIAFGAVLQALLGAFLIRRSMAFPNFLEREREIGLFVLYGAASCVVSASVGTTILWLDAVLASEELLFSWFTWWVGDVIGVWIFTPMVLLLAWKQRSKQVVRRQVAVVAPSLVMFFLVVFFFVFVRDAVAAQGVATWLMLIAGLMVTAMFSTLLLIVTGREHLIDGIVRSQTKALQRNNVALKKAKQEAEHAYQVKTAFLANMSHEMRTPLNGVLGMAQYMTNLGLTKEQETCMRSLYTAGDALLGMINNILDFSKIEAGEVTLEERPFDLRKLAEEVTRLLEVKAKEKGLALTWEVEDQVPEIVVGDSFRIRQVLLNFLSNAVAFTEKGSVKVRLLCVRRQKQSVVLRCEVRDTGIGIAKSKQQRIFKPFLQADVSTTRKFGGTGLGLAICQHLVTLMQGKIGVKSKVGQGSHFWFEIKLAFR